jgi:hypothetical protein
MDKKYCLILLMGCAVYCDSAISARRAPTVDGVEWGNHIEYLKEKLSQEEPDMVAYRAEHDQSQIFFSSVYSLLKDLKGQLFCGLGWHILVYSKLFENDYDRANDLQLRQAKQYFREGCECFAILRDEINAYAIGHYALEHNGDKLVLKDDVLETGDLEGDGFVKLDLLPADRPVKDVMGDTFMNTLLQIEKLFNDEMLNRLEMEMNLQRKLGLTTDFDWQNNKLLDQ